QGEVVGIGDFDSQMRRVFENLGTALESEGLSFPNVAQMITYLVGEETISDFYRVRKDLFASLYPDGKFPPNTLLVVSRLVRPEFLIEVHHREVAHPTSVCFSPRGMSGEASLP